MFVVPRADFDWVLSASIPNEPKYEEWKKFKDPSSLTSTLSNNGGSIIEKYLFCG